jgi:hypothetical protein
MSLSFLKKRNKKNVSNVLEVNSTPNLPFQSPRAAFTKESKKKKNVSNVQVNPI